MAKQWNQLERLDHKALKKLQAEREKAAKLEAAAKERRKYIGIGIVIVLVLVFFLWIILFMKDRAAKKAFAEEREKLMFSEVTESSGDIEFRKSDDWQTLPSGLKFKEMLTFRTGEDSTVNIRMQLENEVKLYGETEATVYVPAFESEKSNKIKDEVVNLTRGEITGIVSIDGRGIMSVETSGVKIVGQSGLFKVKYNDDDGIGEVVVKNGLVEVSKKIGGGKPIKITGFYKVTFEGDEISNPTQASIIQYDWR